MTVRVLGPLEVEVGGDVVALASARQRALLAALVMHPREVVSVDRLADAVWREQMPRSATDSLRTLVARLRKALDSAAPCLMTRPAGYVLLVDDQEIDAQVFVTRYDAARAQLAGDPAAAARLLDEALALWRGDAYDEFALGYARPEATRLEQLRLSALQDRAAAALHMGTYDDAVVRASALVAAHPLRERPVELLVRGLHAAGRTAEALAAYHEHRALVADELGLDPSPALRQLEAQILRDEMPRRPPSGALESTRRPVTADRPAARALPWRPSPLIDRADDLRMLCEWVTVRPLITLTGPGGVGKTRLALEIAHTVQTQVQVWWVDLAAVTAGRLIDALAEATGVDLDDRHDPARSLCDALSVHRGLLCLDNAEHLLGVLAPIVERLLDATSTLSLLVTSRERLAVDVETSFVVAPLPLPSGPDRQNPAVRMFVDRSPRLREDELTEDHLRVIAELCRQLDGLPLAIELAAAQAAVLGLDLLAGRLVGRLDLLAGGRRTASTRHRTLRAVVDWSHDLLTDDEARLLARLAVFPGSFRLDQVESVCTDDRISSDAVVALVARLVEQSLMQGDGGTFWLLETIRRYAEERLDDAGELHSMRSRHAVDTADRLAVLTGKLWTTDEGTAVRELTALVADLHAAWEHAKIHDRMLAVRLAADIFDYAYFRQRLDLLEWGVSVASWETAHPSVAKALAAAAAAAWIVGRPDDSQRYTVQAITAAGGPNQPSAATAIDVAADLAMFGNRTEEAVTGYRAAAALFHAAGDHVRGLCTEIGACQALAYAGRFDEVDATMAELLPRAQHAGNPTTLALAHFVIGEAASAARRFDQANSCRP